ncbi:cation transporter [Microbacterium sp. WCS2018Hpa-9]|uniref:cation transporter n=1 Tax=Microbacterium sp. WCS2018Hpa-9 TaxID=3073635 RepID=UPI00288B06DE|nr:cation transporter [Microbacterium sp. WCS2018Hpa-9]
MTGTREGAKAEQRSLRVSIALSVALAVIALIVGMLSGTRIIIFDGAYMLIGLILSWASLKASTTVAAGPTSRFPFGRDALAPFVVAIQGVAIAGTLLYAAGDAVVVIRDGGSAVNPVVIVTYGAITAGVGWFAASWLPRIARGSDLVVAEAAQWRAGAVLSIVMAAGAVAAMVIERTEIREIVQYIDPILVLISCAILAPIPVRLIRSGLNELLEGAPPAAVADEIARVVAQVRERFALGEPIVRSSKVGRKLYVEVDFVVMASQWDVSEEDDVRHAIIDGLAPLGLEVWASISLTTDPGLTD